MKRFGFRAAFAGGVEATSSMGGQIMPPVMGAVAFIMAETLNVPYAEVVKAALIPALLYFGACFWMVHLESGKFGLSGMAQAELPNPWDADPRALAADPAARGARLPALRRLHADLRRHHGARAHHRADPRDAARGADRAAARSAWCSGSRSGSRAAAFLRSGVDVLALVVGALVAGLRVLPGRARDAADLRRVAGRGGEERAAGRHRLRHRRHRHRHADADRHRLDLHRRDHRHRRDNLLLSLVLTMLTCLMLGMGIPTIPNYIITSSIAGPALLALDVPLLVSHMFVFYFGIMADLTPPVALAAFAAAPMAKVSGMTIARAGDEARGRRLRRAVHGGLHPVADAAGRRRRSPRASAIRSRSPTSSSRPASASGSSAPRWSASSSGRCGSGSGSLAGAAAILLVLACRWTDEAGFALAAVADRAALVAARAPGAPA